MYGPDGGPPIPVQIQPEDFHDVAQQFITASTTIYQVLPTLFRVLDGFRGPAGIDTSATQFDAAYRPAVTSVIDGVSRTVNLLGDIGRMNRLSSWPRTDTRSSKARKCPEERGPTTESKVRSSTTWRDHRQGTQHREQYFRRRSQQTGQPKPA
jgi:hypothetical protein